MNDALHTLSEIPKYLNQKFRVYSEARHKSVDLQVFVFLVQHETQ